MATINTKRKELQRELASLKSIMADIDAQISVKEETGDDTSELSAQFGKLNDRVTIKQLAIVRAEALADADPAPSTKKAKGRAAKDDDDDAEDDDEDNDDDDDDDDDEDKKAEKFFSAPARKSININRNTALAPFKKGELVGRIAVAQFYKKEFGLRKALAMVDKT